MKLIRFFLRNHYLKKIHEGKLDVEDVAKIYGTSIENVENAYQEYLQHINPFKKINLQQKQGFIQISISLVSILFVLLSLHETQMARDTAHKPSISIGNADTMFAWNTDGNFTKDITNDFADRKDIQELWEKNKTTYATSSDFNVEIQNTGEGVAREVYIDWMYEDNYLNFQEYFEGDKNITLSGSLLTDIEINWKDKTLCKETSDYGEQYIFGFLSSNQTAETVKIPKSYIWFMRFVCRKFAEDANAKEPPYIVFKISCIDIQGKKYVKDYYFDPIIDIARIDEDGGGLVAARLVTKEGEEEDELLETVRANLQNYAKVFLAVVVCICIVLFILKKWKDAIERPFEEKKKDRDSEKQTGEKQMSEEQMSKKQISGKD